MKVLHSYQSEDLDEVFRHALIDLEEWCVTQLDEYTSAGTAEVSKKFLDVMHLYEDPTTSVKAERALGDIENRCIKQLVDFFTNEVTLRKFDEWTLDPHFGFVSRLFYRSLLNHATRMSEFNETVSTISTDPKVLITDVRRVLEKAKIANASSMPIDVGDGGIRGVHKREADGYYVKRDRKHRIKSHIERDAHGVWHMKMVRSYN